MAEYNTEWYGKPVYDGHAESKWTHLICIDDWNKRNPDRIVPQTYGADNEPEPCCWCSELTGAGIYLRADPKEVHHA